MSRFYSSLTLCVIMFACLQSIADDWPQWRGPTRDGVWHETEIIESFATEKLDTVWSTKISSGYSAPTVSNGKVFITDRIVNPEQIERVHCLNEETGKILWTYEYEARYSIGYTAGPRAAVTIDGDYAYALGAVGHLHCFKVSDGSVVWKHNCDKEYGITENKRMPIWGIASAPIVHGKLLIAQIGGMNACIVAFDKVTGKEVWKSLTDRASYSAPIIIKQGKETVMICWTGDHIVGLNPENGEVYWKHHFPPRKMIINIPSPVLAGEHLFMTAFYDGSLLLKLDQTKPGFSLVWRRIGKDERNTDALHSIMSIPVILGDHIYGVDSYGELRCLDLKTGDRIWEDKTAAPQRRWGNIHTVKNGDRFWMFNGDGELIIAKLDKEGYHEISRAQAIETTTKQLNRRDGVCWAHPAYANKRVYLRNDNRIICIDLSKK